MNFYLVTALTRQGFEDSFEWANTAHEAITKVRAVFGYDLVSVSARRAVMNEWICSRSISGACTDH